MQCLHVMPRGLWANTYTENSPESGAEGWRSLACHRKVHTGTLSPGSCAQVTAKGRWGTVPGLKIHSQVPRVAAKHRVKLMANKLCVFPEQWKCGNSGRKSLEDLQEAWIWRTKEPKLVMSMRNFHEFSNLVLFCWARLPDIRALHAAGVYCCSKALWEHHLSCSTIGQRSWKLKLRLSLVQINRNTKEKSCTWSSAFFPFCYLHEIQFCPSAIFFKDDQHSFLWCMQRISLPSQAKKGSTLYSE